MDLKFRPFDHIAPDDPICVGCGKTPDQIPEYLYAALAESAGVLSPAEYVIGNEGTYNRENGHFTCTECYVELGMPTRPNGWKAP